MVLGKGSSLAVGLFFNNKARVESLGTALASTTLQAKPPWARVMAKQVPQCICEAQSMDLDNPWTGFGQSMDKVAMDPYFERAIHGLSKHKITHRVVLEQASFPPPTRDQVCPLARKVSFYYRDTMQTF